MSTSVSSLHFQPQSQAVTVNDSRASRQVFDGRGHDFLDPNNIGGTTTGFSNSIRPISSNTSHAALFGGNPISKNANAASILSQTGRGLNSALNFTLEFNPGNMDPKNWHNPTATDITLGILNGQSSIFNGMPQFAPLHPFPPVPFPSSGAGSGHQSGGFNPMPTGVGFNMSGALMSALQPMPMPFPIQQPRIFSPMNLQMNQMNNLNVFAQPQVFSPMNFQMNQMNNNQNNLFAQPQVFNPFQQAPIPAPQHGGMHGHSLGHDDLQFMRMASLMTQAGSVLNSMLEHLLSQKQA